jgi:hypothetical protein
VKRAQSKVLAPLRTQRDHLTDDREDVSCREYAVAIGAGMDVGHGGGGEIRQARESGRKLKRSGERWALG